ncbi:unnamed protein product, partial [Trichobilharzia regenti]
LPFFLIQDGASSSSSAPGCSGVHLGVTDDRPSPPSSSCRSTKNNLKHPISVPIVVSDSQRERKTVFRSKPLLVLRGHEGVVTELAWSKNLFLLATSMDHQVRLWHISRRECLCVFSHNDTVPTIVFHPKDDRYFLSGSLDGKLRLWNIPDKKVPSSSNTVTSLFTRSSPYNNSQYTTSILGTKVVVGTYDGRVLTKFRFSTLMSNQSISVVWRLDTCVAKSISIRPLQTFINSCLHSILKIRLVTREEN